MSITLSRAAQSALMHYGILLPSGDFHSKISSQQQKALKQGRALVLSSGAKRLRLSLSPEGKLLAEHSALSRGLSAALSPTVEKPLSFFQQQQKEPSKALSEPRVLFSTANAGVVELPVLSGGKKLREALRENPLALEQLKKHFQQQEKYLSAQLHLYPSLRKQIEQRRAHLLEAGKKLFALVGSTKERIERAAPQKIPQKELNTAPYSDILHAEKTKTVSASSPSRELEQAPRRGRGR